MPNRTGKMYYCQICKRTMSDDNFYTSNRLDKYPAEGKLLECKKCVTRHVNNFDPETYLWLLEEIDVPYIKQEWDVFIEKYCQNPEKITGMTVLGRYLSKMKLKQWKEYRWEDGIRLQEEADQKAHETMLRQGYNEEQIAEQQQEFAERYVHAGPIGSGTPTEATPAIDMVSPDGFIDDLTEEDKLMLSLKWGKVYRPYEWVQLEQYYMDMMQSYDIQTPSHIDYLKLICKTSLKTHQLLDLADIDAFQKMSRVYDALMKSAKFTPLQDKTEHGEFVNAIGELALVCEKEGFIPRYYTDGPQDKVDETLTDMRRYLDTLVREEMNLGNLIENALRAMKHEEEKEEDDESTLTEDIIEEVLADADFEAFTAEMEEQLDADHANLMNLLEEE